MKYVFIASGCIKHGHKRNNFQTIEYRQYVDQKWVFFSEFGNQVETQLYRKVWNRFGKTYQRDKMDCSLARLTSFGSYETQASLSHVVLFKHLYGPLSLFYGLNCVPQNSYIWSPTSQCNCIWI